MRLAAVMIYRTFLEIQRYRLIDGSIILQLRCRVQPASRIGQHNCSVDPFDAGWYNPDGFSLSDR